MSNVVTMPAPTRLTLMRDSFRNFLAGFGVPGRDKVEHHEPHFRLLTQKDLDTLYRCDWISRKIVEIPAFDMTRMWRSWHADSAQIEDIEKVERDFGVQRKLMEVLVKSRLSGGAVIVIGVDGAGDMTEELDVERVGKDSLRFLHVVDRWAIMAGARIRDISSPYYGEPAYYQRAVPVDAPPIGGVELASPAPEIERKGHQLFIHPSRVVRFIGAEYPDIDRSPDQWGDSALQPVYDAVLQLGMVNSSMASMLAEMKLDIIKIPGMSNSMSTVEGAQELRDRFMNSNAAKSIVNTLMLDSEEEFVTRQLQLSNLDKVMQTYMLVAAGAADIPATRLVGLRATESAEV